MGSSLSEPGVRFGAPRLSYRNRSLSPSRSSPSQSVAEHLQDGGNGQLFEAVVEQLEPVQARFSSLPIVHHLPVQVALLVDLDVDQVQTLEQLVRRVGIPAQAEVQQAHRLRYGDLPLPHGGLAAREHEQEGQLGV